MAKEYTAEELAQLKQKATQQYIANLKWAKEQFTAEEIAEIKSECAALYQARPGNPFIINASNCVKPKKDEQGNYVRNEQGKIVAEGKLFEIRGAVFESAITTPNNKYFHELKFSVLRDDYKQAARLIYSTFTTWLMANGKQQATGEDLFQCFGGRNLFWVNPKKDENDQIIEGQYYVNFCVPVVTHVDDQANSFQLAAFKSQVYGKELNIQNADSVLSPSDTNKAFVSISMDVHMNKGKNNRCEFRAQTIKLINSPFQNNSLSADQLLDLAMEDDAPAPAPTMASQAPTAPQQAAPAPAVAPEQISPIEPNDADMAAIMENIMLDI